MLARDEATAFFFFFILHLLVRFVLLNATPGDARNVNKMFKTGFDRIVMPAPYGQNFSLDIAQSVLKPGGYVHFYTLRRISQYLHFRRLLEEKGWFIDFYRDCGDVAQG